MHIIRFGKAKKSVEKHLEAMGVSDVKNGDSILRKKLFFDGVTNYKDGTYSLDEFACLCEMLWLAETDKDDPFAKILIMGAELSYRERKSVEEKGSSIDFILDLKDVLSYHE